MRKIKNNVIASNCNKRGDLKLFWKRLLRFARNDLVTFGLLLTLAACAPELRGTGDLGLVVERADGRIAMIENSTNTKRGEVAGLGDLSHASAVYSRDQRYAYIFGRDGGLTKVDLLTQSIVKRVIQSGNSIGGAISQDGRLIAVANYTPGGVKVFASDSLELLAEIPATCQNGKQSKVVGLEDGANNRFAFSLYDCGEIWLADLSQPKNPQIQKYFNIGKLPYDALVTYDGRYYIAGLFGEDGMALLDLWHPEAGVKRIMDHYGKGEQALPVYKMPHLEGWAMAGDEIYLPAIGRHEVLIVDPKTWQEKGRIAVKGQPIFVMARPDGRQVWVNFALPHNQFIQVIDTEKKEIVKTLEPGKGVLHMEFTPRGEEIWLSVRDENKVEIYSTQSLNKVKEIPASNPSGIFFTSRAVKMGL